MIPVFPVFTVEVRKDSITITLGSLWIRPFTDQADQIARVLLPGGQLLVKAINDAEPRVYRSTLDTEWVAI